MFGTNEKIEFVKKALRNRDVKELEELLESGRFTKRIDPLELPRLEDAELGQIRLTAKYKDLQEVRRIVKKHGRPLTLLRSPDGITLNADLTDYIKPYQNGFVRTNLEENLVAGYGILEEIFIDRLKRLREPHHFFFISEYKKKDNLGTLLISKAQDSPLNPAKVEEGGVQDYLSIAAGVTLLEAVPLFSLFFLRNAAAPIQYLHDVLNDVSLHHHLETVTGLLTINFSLAYGIYKNTYGSKNVGTYARSRYFSSEHGWKSYRKFVKMRVGVSN